VTSPARAVACAFALAVCLRPVPGREGIAMTKHKVTTREEWLSIRGELLCRHGEYQETDAAGR